MNKNAKLADSTNILALFIVLIFLALAGLAIASDTIISINGKNLTDSTIYNHTSNICSASRYGMSLEVYPCKVKSVVAIDLTQYVDFKWSGINPQKTSWVFVYEGQLEKGQIFVQENQSYSYNSPVQVNRWASDYPVNNVNSLTNLGTPTEFLCEIGNSNNTLMYKVNQTINSTNMTTTLKNYCFTNFTQINSSSYLISGNYWSQENISLNSSKDIWTDVSSYISYMGYGLLNDNRSYYQVQNITFNPNQIIKTKWIYTPFNKTKSGEWYVFGYDANLNILDAIDNEVYLFLDPSWNSSFSDGLKYYYKLNETSGTTAWNILGNNGNFTSLNGKWVASGIIGGAYRVGGESVTGGYNTANITGTNNAFTINFWVNRTSGPADWQGKITGNDVSGGLNANGKWHVCTDGANGIWLEIKNQTAIYDIGSNPYGVLPLNKWEMITFTWNGTTGVLYRNASKTGNSVNALGFDPKLIAQNIYFFGRSDATTEMVKPNNLTFDEISVYNRSLDVSEISGLFNSGLAITWQPELPSPPQVLFNYQLPSDITSFNALVSGVNVSYNISFSNGINLSTVKLYEKINSSLRADTICYNGTCSSAYAVWNYIENVSETFIWNLDDNGIYPATYNFAETYMKNTQKSTGTLTSANQYLAIEFLNVTNLTQYNFFEIMSNSTDVMRFYYCNDSYGFSNNPTTNANCLAVSTLPANSPYNHTHNVFDAHQVISLALNVTTGQIGTIKLTPTSYILLRGNNGAGNEVNYYYITNTTRSGAMRTTTNGGNAWTNQTYTVASHIHQFSETDSLYYYVCANDTTNLQNCTDLRQDIYQLAGLPPTVFVSSPIEKLYKGNIDINYSALSPNSYEIVNYTIDLLNSTYGLNKTLVDNTTNLGYTWDSSTSTDGMYVIRVKAMDNLSQSGYGYSENFTLDSTPPILNITYPVNNTLFNYVSINVNYTVSDLGVLDSCWYYNETGNTTITCGTNITLVVSQGNHTLIVYVNDSLNNINSKSVSFFVDSIYPLIDYGIGTAVTGINLSQSNIYINTTWTETNFANITFNVYLSNGTLASSYNSSSPVYAHNFTALSDGGYIYNVTLCDIINNCNSTSSRIINLDITPPNATLLTPINNTFTNNQTQNFTANLTDNLGIANATLYIYNSSNDLVNQTTVTYSPGIVQATIGIIVNLIDDVYHWFYQVFDVSGNSYTTENNTLTIDTVKPILTIDYPVSGSFYQIHITTLNVSLNENGGNCTVNSSFWTLNSENSTFFNFVNSTEAIDGIFNYNITCWDTSGNNASILLNYTQDTELPVVVMANNSYSTSDNTPSIFFNATDNLDLALSCALYLNGTGYGGTIVTSGIMDSITTNATVPDGNYSINVTCYDNVNNIGFNDTTWIFIDSLFPQINIVYPQNINYSINVSRLNYTIFDINAQTCWYSLNNGTTNTSINCGTNATNLTSHEGYNTWKVWANDTLNNVNSSSVTFLKDTIYPSINFTSPTDIGLISSSRNDIKINVIANDSNLDNIKIFFYNSSKDLVNSATFTLSPAYVDFTSLSNGVYFFNASANDTVGNTNWTELRNATVNLTVTPPSGGGGGGIAVYENSTLICEYVYNLISYNKGRLNYSVAELNNFTSFINNNTSPTISSYLTESYIEDFETRCNKTYPKFKKLLENFTFLDYESKNLSCNKDINATFTVLNIKFNMDSSIPFFSINMQNLSCNSLDWFKWFFRISGSEGIYYINGLKLYWILIAGILAVTIFLIISLRKGERYERKSN